MTILPEQNKYRVNFEMPAMLRKREKGLRFFLSVLENGSFECNGIPLQMPFPEEQVIAFDIEKKKEDLAFKWIDEENGKFFSRNEESKETRYFLSKSAFWRTIEQIWKKLYKRYETVVTVPENARFFDYIAWSNLYKVAPRASRNPTDKMCGRQLDVCRRILKAEIDAYQPTHILLITDYDNWFANKDFDFSSIFADTKRIGSNYENKSVYVEGTAKYELGKQTIPVIITCRPESRKEKPFVDDVNNYFQICGE